MSYRARALTNRVILLTAIVGCGPHSSIQPGSRVLSAFSAGDAEDVRNIERERLRALVNANMDVARPLHAEDFQAINPLGRSLSKEQYLSSVASGESDYLYWEPDTISVRLYGAAAVIRYRSEAELVVRGQKIPRRAYWNTGSYEKRNSRWRIVWFQVTEIK